MLEFLYIIFTKSIKCVFKKTSSSISVNYTIRYNNSYICDIKHSLIIQLYKSNLILCCVPLLAAADNYESHTVDKLSYYCRCSGDKQAMVKTH